MRVNSISHKLVLTIVVPVITVLTTLGILNYFDTKLILNQLISTEQDFIRNEISSFVELQFVALDIIEEPIQLQMENYSKLFINQYYNNTIDASAIDLYEVRKNLGMDKEAYDLYLINKEGVVINSTYQEDLGINFFNFGEVHKQYLLSIFKQGIFDSPKFFFENTTKKYKKYSYQATEDKQYIFEIGLYSNQADRVFDYMINHLNKITDQRKNLTSIELYFWLDKPTSLDPNKQFNVQHNYILPLLENGEFVNIKNITTGKTDYTYLYVKNLNSKLIKGAIVQIQHDHSYQQDFEKKEKLKFLVVFVIAIVLILIVAFFINPIGRVIKNITSIAKELAVGNLSTKVDSKLLNRKDELGDLSNAIDTLITGLTQTAEFARQTGKGNFDKKYELLSEKDVLGKTLLKMQERLTRARIKEEENIAEEKQNKFVTDGLALFAETLRQNNHDVSILCNKTMRQLVDYLNFPMGALFIANHNEDKIYFEAISTVAYDRLKLFEKKIKIGEGLVGRCGFEKLPIYINEIPEDYLELSSGLGTAQPNYLLLIPLISENKIYGVIELASFNAIKKHVISFTEKLAESIAATLASVQMNQQTVQLLEQSRVQSEELAEHEEEMRQNMEELQATQEESLKREEDLLLIVEAFDKSAFRVVYNSNGTIVDCNDKYSQFLNQTSENLIGSSYQQEAKTIGLEVNILDNIWKKLNQGIAQENNFEIEINRFKKQLHEFYWPIEKDGKTSVIKISYLT